MAKYNVVHTCGHTVRFDLIGNHDDRRATLAREARRPCRSCWLRAQRQESAVLSDRVSETHRLGDLTGTERQVKWANDIRAKFVASLESSPASAQRPAQTALLLRAAAAQTSAKFWIDGRDNLNGALVSTTPADERAAAEASDCARVA